MKRASCKKCISDCTGSIVRKWIVSYIFGISEPGLGQAWVGLGERVLLWYRCVFSLFVLHLVIMRVDVNLIQKLCYMEGGIPWRESSFLWATYAQNVFAVCILVRAEMKEWGSCDWLSELWESGGLVPQFTPTLPGREQFACPLFKPSIVQRCGRWPPSVPAFGSKVLG